MNQASFSIQKSKLLNELKCIAKSLGKASKYAKATVLELTITDSKLTLVIPGAKFELECETKHTAKATVSKVRELLGDYCISKKEIEDFINQKIKI